MLPNYAFERTRTHKVPFERASRAVRQPLTRLRGAAQRGR